MNACIIILEPKCFNNKQLKESVELNVEKGDS